MSCDDAGDSGVAGRADSMMGEKMLEISAFDAGSAGSGLLARMSG
jgi:hypothetical protein